MSLFFSSLPKDQDCHELWCKNRKKEMRDMHHYTDKPSRYAWKEKSQSHSNSSMKAAATTATTHSKISGSQRHSSTSNDRNEASRGPSSATGQDQSSNAPVDKHKSQAQLDDLLGVLRTQKSITEERIAQCLGSSVNEQTLPLLMNLKKQLMSAISKGKNNSIGEKGDSSSGFASSGSSSMTSVPQDDTSSQLPSSNWPPTDEQEASNPDSIGRDSNNEGSGMGGKTDKHAGVKAALANLLSQQGIAVGGGPGSSNSGSRIDIASSSQSSTPHRSQYSSQSSFSEPPRPDGANFDQPYNNSSRSQFPPVVFYGDHPQGPPKSDGNRGAPFHPYGRDRPGMPGAQPPSRNTPPLLGNPNRPGMGNPPMHNRNPYERDYPGKAPPRW